MVLTTVKNQSIEVYYGLSTSSHWQVPALQKIDAKVRSVIPEPLICGSGGGEKLRRCDGCDRRRPPTPADAQRLSP